MKVDWSRYLDLSDAMLIGYLLALALVAWATESMDSEPSTSPRTEQNVTLSEDALRRLENGDTYRLDRWHGHSVELRADLVVDATDVEQDADNGGD